MKLTMPGTDYIQIDDSQTPEMFDLPRVHLIKLRFEEPTEEKVFEVAKTFPSTNRYIIEDNVRIYNFIFKGLNKKFYVENKENCGLVSFFRKNNKVLLNFDRLNMIEKSFIKDNLYDVVRNVEVIQMTKDELTVHFNVLDRWRGNVIISNFKEQTD